MMKFAALLCAASMTTGCAASLSSSTAGDVTGPVVDPGERATGTDSPALSLTSCATDGPNAELCRSERDCVDGDAPSCLAAATYWRERGPDRIHWARLYARRACAGGLAEGCEAASEATAGTDGAPRRSTSFADIGETAVDAPLLVPALKVTRERAFGIRLDGEDIIGDGLPAVSSDGLKIAHLEVVGEPSSSTRAVSLLVMDAGADRIEARIPILVAGERLDREPCRGDVLARIDDANRRLDLTEWERMAVVTRGPEVLVDCAHLEDTEAGEVCVQTLTVGDLSLRWAEPLFAVGDAETKRPSWTVEKCRGQSYVAIAAASPDGGALMLEIGYRRTDDCEDQPPAVHAVKID